MHSYSGEAAALGAALGWTISSLCWTAAGKRVGSMVVNTVRLVIALPLFLLYGQLVLGEAIPFSASNHAWLYLGISGVLGFFVCDLFLFRSFLIIGPRLAMLIFSLSPLVSSALGWWWLDENLSPLNISGMLIALSGVAWVVLESPRVDPAINVPAARRIPWHGTAFAFLAMLAQGFSSPIAKYGMQDIASPMAATQIRLITGLICFLILMPLAGKAGACLAAFKDRRAMAILTTGAIAGPTLGVALLMFSFIRIPTGLAMTFTSLVPVLIIPFVVIIHKERVSLRAIFGAIVACTGSALLLI